MAKYTTDADLNLLDELGVDIAPAQTATQSPREERIIAGFEEIERFVAENGHLPQHGEDRDIFERLYAVRLDRLRESEECRTILAPLDSQGLLNAEAEPVWPQRKTLTTKHCWLLWVLMQYQTRMLSSSPMCDRARKLKQQRKSHSGLPAKISMNSNLSLTKEKLVQRSLSCQPSNRHSGGRSPA